MSDKSPQWLMFQIFFIVLVAFTAWIFFPVDSDADDIDDYRLPNTTSPFQYRIEIATHLDLDLANNDSYKFQGKVSINITANIDTNSIVVHQRGLVITNYSFSNASFGFPAYNWSIGTLEYNATTEKLTFPLLDTPLLKDQKGTLEIVYNGIMQEQHNGMLKKNKGLSTYKYGDRNGDTHRVAATFLGLTFAREVFPCYNEPHFRTPITLVINCHQKFVPISNMDEAGSQQIEDRVITRFKPTPPMPVYLLAFVIADDFGTTTVDKVKIHARRDRLEEVDFAKNAAVKISGELEIFFDQRMRKPDLGMVAVQELEKDAMEFWGLIVYRETNLLVGVDSSVLNQFQVLAVVAHEIAHMFFGNLVGITGWDQFWIKEAPATWWSYKVVDHLFPTYNSIDRMHMNIRGTMLEDTQFPFSLVEDVQTPAEIELLVAVNRYYKSAAVFYMWEYVLTPDVFRNGLRKYLTDMVGKTANTDDLGKALKEAGKDVVPAHIDFNVVVNSWAHIPGLPLVNITRTKDDFILSQDQFTTTGSARKNTTWAIPITFATAVNPDFTIPKPYTWLTSPSQSIPRANLVRDNNDWLLANVQQVGYYRVNYDKKLWKLLWQQLNSSYDVIHYRNRAQLIDDSLYLALGGYINLTIPLKIMNYLDQEREFLAWEAASTGLKTLLLRFQDSETDKPLREFIVSKVEPVITDIGTADQGKGERLQRKMLRNTIIELGGLVGIQKVINETRIMVEQFVHNRTAIASDLRKAAICAGLRNAETDTFNVLLNEISQLKDQAGRAQRIEELACTRVLDQQKHLLGLAVDLSLNLNGEERSLIVQYVCLNGGGTGVSAGIEFLKEQWQIFNAYTRPGTAGVFARHIGGIVTTPAQQDAYAAMADTLIAGGDFTEEQKTEAMTLIAENIKWAQDNRPFK